MFQNYLIVTNTKLLH